MFLNSQLMQVRKNGDNVSVSLVAPGLDLEHIEILADDEAAYIDVSKAGDAARLWRGLYGRNAISVYLPSLPWKTYSPTGEATLDKGVLTILFGTKDTRKAIPITCPNH